MPEIHPERVEYEGEKLISVRGERMIPTLQCPEGQVEKPPGGDN